MPSDAQAAITITLPDGTCRCFDHPVTVADVAVAEVATVRKPALMQ